MKRFNFPRFLRNFQTKLPTDLLTYQLPVSQTINSFKPCSDISNFLRNDNFTYIPPQPRLSSDTVRPSQWRYVTVTISHHCREKRSQKRHSPIVQLNRTRSQSRFPFQNRARAAPRNPVKPFSKLQPPDGPQRAVKVRASCILLARQ